MSTTNFRPFSSPQKETLCPSAVALHYPHPSPLTTSHLLCNSINLPALDITYAWDGTELTYF